MVNCLSNLKILEGESNVCPSGSKGHVVQLRHFTANSLITSKLAWPDEDRQTFWGILCYYIEVKDAILV